MTTASLSACLDELRDALGAAFSDGLDDLERARADKSGQRSDSRPAAVVHARGVEDVQTTLRIASAHRCPVVTRGAGTGLSGGAIGARGEIVLSVASMDRILEINSADELAVVEPGVINQDLNDALATHGLWFAPDPASKAISTVGGNIATNAGGLLCAKYGVTRDAVLGLKVALADGEILTVGHRSVKGVTGLDLAGLMVGSEGTLGVIVEATVRVRPLVTAQETTVAGYFPDIEAAARAAARIVAEGLRPAVLELVDATALEAISAYLSLPAEGPARPYLLAQFDEFDTVERGRRARDLMATDGATARVSTDAAEAANLLAIRRAFHSALEARGSVLIEDVSVPRSAMPAMFAEIQRISTAYGVPIPTVAHAGDGNLHPNFVFGAPGGAVGDADDVPAHIWEAAGELFAAALSMGGTLTGEHGVGLLKRRWLEDEVGERSLRLQQQIKAVFDPLGILNPGKAV